MAPYRASGKGLLGRGKRTLADILTIVGFLVIVAFFGGPILWLVSLSLRTTDQIFAYPPKLLPHPFSLEAYREVFRGREIVTFLGNSVKLSLLSSVGALLVCVPAGYALSRFAFRRKDLFLLVLLLFQMISPVVIVIPLYEYFNLVGLLNSHFGVLLVYIAMLIPFITWMLKGFFDSIPLSIEEAALIDGCSRARCVLRIVLPIAATGVFSCFIFCFLLSWSQFIVPMILLSDNSLIPISVGILLFENGRTAMSTHVVAAASVLTILPPVIVFILLQRYVVQMYTAGAVKG